MRLIKPCDARVCKTTWGCGGSCTAGVLTINGNGQGEWCSRSGSAESAGGQWLDLDLGSSKTVTSIQLWSGVSGNRFPQKLQVLTGGGADGSTNGGNGCFDKKGDGLSATDGSWKVAAGPFVIGSGTSLDGCANARLKAGVNTQSEGDECVVPVPAGKVAGRYIRLHFLGTAGNDNYMELRGLKVFGTAADAHGAPMTTPSPSSTEDKAPDSLDDAGLTAAPVRTAWTLTPISTMTHTPTDDQSCFQDTDSFDCSCMITLQRQCSSEKLRKQFNTHSIADCENFFVCSHSQTCKSYKDKHCKSQLALLKKLRQNNVSVQTC